MQTDPQTSRTELTPKAVLTQMKEGNARFVGNRQADRDLMEQVRLTSGGQYPIAIVLGCVDSRVPPEVIFDKGIGDIFSARIAGNFVNSDILGSMEFACKVAGAKLILVLGHSQCGAIMGATDGVELGNLTGMLHKLQPAVDATPAPIDRRNSQNAEFVQQVAEKNVELTVEAIKQHSPVLREMLDKGEIAIAGAMYDVESGIVRFL